MFSKFSELFQWYEGTRNTVSEVDNDDKRLTQALVVIKISVKCRSLVYKCSCGLPLEVG